MSQLDISPLVQRLGSLRASPGAIAVLIGSPDLPPNTIRRMLDAEAAGSKGSAHSPTPVARGRDLIRHRTEHAALLASLSSAMSHEEQPVAEMMADVFAAYEFVTSDIPAEQISFDAHVHLRSFLGASGMKPVVDSEGARFV